VIVSRPAFDVIGLDFDAELPVQAFARDRQVRLAHPQSRVCLVRVAFEAQGRVLVEQPVQGVGEACRHPTSIWAGCATGSTGFGGSNESTSTSAPRAEHVTGRCVAQLGHRGDVAGGNLRRRLLLLAHDRELMQPFIRRCGC
jgi:hypothetical protein